MKVQAWAALGPGEKLVPYQFEPGKLAPDEVEIEVDYCGLCHSDISMLDNDWGISVYPLVPGHEIVGRICRVGGNVLGLEEGQVVGVGWTSGSCMRCRQCLSGNQHLCGESSATIVGHPGGFSQRVRAHWQWVFPLPEHIDPSEAGPLMCGGVTVFSPLVINGIMPTDRVGVVGIGGLGHLAIQFARAWGCEVTALTHSESKFGQAKTLGAHHVVSSTDSAALRSMAGKLDMLLVTVNVPLDWRTMVATLAPRGRLHIVGVVEEPVPVNAFDLIAAQRCISGSPTGSPEAMATMLDFAARHRILPQVEHFPMSQVNEAVEYLKAGKPRYRVVLDADF